MLASYGDDDGPSHAHATTMWPRKGSRMEINNDLGVGIKRVLAARLAARGALGGDLKEPVAQIAALETGVLGTTEARCRGTSIS